MCPPKNSDRFGCAPYVYYCSLCAKSLPSFFNTSNSFKNSVKPIETTQKEAINEKMDLHS